MQRVYLVLIFGATYAAPCLASVCFLRGKVGGHGRTLTDLVSIPKGDGGGARPAALPLTVLPSDHVPNRAGLRSEQPTGPGIARFCFRFSFSLAGGGEVEMPTFFTGQEPRKTVGGSHF